MRSVALLELRLGVVVLVVRDVVEVEVGAGVVVEEVVVRSVVVVDAAA